MESKVPSGIRASATPRPRPRPSPTANNWSDSSATTALHGMNSPAAMSRKTSPSSSRSCPVGKPPQTQPVEGVEATWAVNRETMRLVSKEMPHTGMAVGIDCGDPIALHPKNKKPIGIRHAYLALKEAYGKDIVPCGPRYLSQKIEGSKITLEFDCIGVSRKVPEYHRFSGRVLGSGARLEPAEVAPAEASKELRPRCFGHIDRRRIICLGVSAPVRVRGSEPLDRRRHSLHQATWSPVPDSAFSGPVRAPRRKCRPTGYRKAVWGPCERQIASGDFSARTAGSNLPDTDPTRVNYAARGQVCPGPRS